MRNVVQRRLRGEFVVDEWGTDEELCGYVEPVIGAVCRVEVDGGEHLPRRNPAVLVFNRRLGVAEPFALQRAVRIASGRRPRFLGIPDVAPVGPAMRRLGGAVARPEELGSLLRAGHLVGVPLGRTWQRVRRAGPLAPGALVAALEHEVPVLPVGIIGGELDGRWRVLVGPPVDRPQGRSPLSLSELADCARNDVQALLDDAFPPWWWGG